MTNNLRDKIEEIMPIMILSGNIRDEVLDKLESLIKEIRIKDMEEIKEEFCMCPVFDDKRICYNCRYLDKKITDIKNG